MQIKLYLTDKETLFYFKARIRRPEHSRSRGNTRHSRGARFIDVLQIMQELLVKKERNHAKGPGKGWSLYKLVDGVTTLLRAF